MEQSIIDRARELELPGRAVIATDAQGTVVYWGEGAVRLYGWSEAEALGRHIVDVTPTDQSRPDATLVMEELARGKSWSGEFLVRAKDGSHFTVEVTDIPVRARSGELVGIIGSSHRKSYIG